MFQALFAALGLVFILEGLMPFLMPDRWRSMMQHMMVQSNKTLRVMGFVSMLIGLSVLYLVR